MQGADRMVRLGVKWRTVCAQSGAQAVDHLIQ
jgi:hypothetical protein